MKYAVRFQFAKTGRSKYISHLDLVRCMQRALRRSGLPVHYTAGFHPHMETTFVAALPLGLESVGEIVEVQFDEAVDLEQAKQQLQAAVPEGIQLIRAYEPVHKMKELGYVLYQLTLPCAAPQELLAQWKAFVQQPEILVEKKTKRGMRTVDILPQLDYSAEAVTSDALNMQLRLPAGTPESVNPSIVLDTFTKFSTVPFAFPAICRLQLCTQEKSEFF